MLLKKGAEASLYLEEWQGRKVIMKRRLPKAYRLSALDEAIRMQRTVHEPQIIHSAKEAGVPTPTIYLVDIADANIIMEFIEGKQVKKVLNNLSQGERINLCHLIGTLIGRLHVHGIVHGDLTTSNMILTSSGKVFFVDFGLSERSSELEARGVDLHLVKRALQSTHYRCAKECFDAAMTGYSEIVGEDVVGELHDKIREIERRGRYVSER
ncbi:MAG: Kae1-associated kinase Bud32 [Candidatus Bathyarchaeota archaeon]|jgi:TP53 regulating kinase-like protein